MNVKTMLVVGGVASLLLLGVIGATIWSMKENAEISRYDSRGYGFGSDRWKDKEWRWMKRDEWHDGEKYGNGIMNGGRRGGGSMGYGGGMNRENCYGDGCLDVDGLDYPAGELSDAAKSALLSALDDEEKALATYEAVMEKFGNVRPFIMVARAEEQHISALKSLFDKYGLSIPENRYTDGSIVLPESLQAACQAGVDAEIANATLYRDTLLPAVQDYPDITTVFTNLMNASQERHLPAFDRCN